MSTKIAMQDQTVNAEKKIDTINTINMVVDTEQGTTVKTGAVAAGSFPITILGGQFSIKTTLNGTIAPGPEKNLLEGMTVNGKIDAAGKLFLDTATAASELKPVIGMLTSGMPKQLKFPDKLMKLGDTFTLEDDQTNMNLPDFGVDMDYPTKVTYKLTAVKDNLAYFDIMSEFKININKEVQSKTVNINGKGSGNDKMEFFIDKGYPKSIVNNVDYALDMTGPNMKVAVKWNLSTDGKYVVNGN
ncbi:MAG: hypothetical protein ACOH2A_00775 [Sphingobacteriaceae bacterium]